MKIILRQTILFFLMLLPFVSQAYASQVSSELPIFSLIYDEQRDPYADGRKALKLAEETHRKVLIEVGGDWCSWCHVLDRFIKDHPQVESRLHEIFVVLKVNISDSNDNVEFMRAFPRAHGYPHMYITDSSGTILHSQDTADFRENKKYSEQRFNAFFDRWENKNE
ncbi:MAG: thioredoxin family protein [Proteobacteria bacterium]|nr:thioredoxin family protein [Pseudomonadota bacterium]